MKKIHVLIAAIALGMASLTSCVTEDLCKDCEVVTYDADSGQEKDRVLASEYCGDDLEGIQDQGASVVGQDSSVYECK